MNEQFLLHWLLTTRGGLKYSFPPNSNDPQATDDVVNALRQELGEANVIEGEPVMASEDFGHLVEPIGVPSVYWFFGGHPAETLAADRIPVNHSPLFAPVMEPTLSTGARAAVAAILSKVGLER